MEEFEKADCPKPELLKPELPKFDIGRPEENDENEENRDRSGRLAANRFELNSERGSRAYDLVGRLFPNDDHPELFEAKLPFLEFPNECHWPSDRALLPYPPDICVPRTRLMLPKECHPPLIAFPMPCADAGIDRPPEFPNEYRPPAMPPELRAMDCHVPERSKLREVGDAPKLPRPKDELRAKLPDEREENPPDLAPDLANDPPPKLPARAYPPLREPRLEFPPPLKLKCPLPWELLLREPPPP